MPTDAAIETIEIDAPYDRVLAVIRDIESVPQWVSEILEAEVLEKNEDSTPARAWFRASTPVGKDEYTLAYEHHRDGMSWSLVEGRLQSGQDARYRLRRLGKNRTAVTYELRITHGLPLPGFLRRKVINGLVHGTLAGLDGYVNVSGSENG
jgi:uncharacterized membrane protein